MAGPRESDQIGQDDTKYALEADDLIAAALESFDRIVDGEEDPDGSGAPASPVVPEPALDEDDDAYLEVVGLQDRLEARAEREVARPAELELDFDDGLDDEGADDPVDPGPPAEDPVANEALLTENLTLQEEVEALREETGTLRGKLKSVKRGQKGQTDSVRVLERKLQRKEEALSMLKMERDDLSGTLKMWEKMVAEMRTAARQAEEEQERVRRRQKKELGEIKMLANEKLFKKIIPALDNLELALNHSEVDGQHTAEQVIEGIKMTATHLFKSVEQAGLDRVQSAIGDSFDPSIHDAVERVEDTSQPADTIAVCLSPGYSLRGRLIRPARVSVYYGGPQASRPEPTGPDGDEG